MNLGVWLTLYMEVLKSECVMDFQESDTSRL